MQLTAITSALPPILPGVGGIALTGFQIMATLTSYKSQTNPETRAGYSKFSKTGGAALSTPAKNVVASDAKEAAAPPTWSSRTGMIVIYTPAALLSIALIALQITPLTPASIMCVVHFLKRVLEVLFLHKYSGTVDRGTPTMIGTYYALLALLICCVADVNPSEMATKVGSVLFAIGIGGNFYHHYLLANLRKGSDTDGAKKYVAPTGGLFDYVATPHYLFELVGWLGIAVAANHMNVYLIFTSMCSYLAGRSVAQNDFNRSKFEADEWPRERKNMVPFVF